MKSVVVSHPTGNPNVRAVIRGMARENLLHSFHTCLAFQQSHHLGRLGYAYNKLTSRRCFPEARESQINCYPTRELFRLFAKRLNLQCLIRHETGWASVDSVYKELDHHVAMYVATHKDDVSAIYAYEDGALESFKTAAKYGLSRYYDLPIPYWRKVREITAEEAEIRPDWLPTMNGLRDSSAKLQRKDDEICIADHIFVASSFTRDSLVNYFGESLDISIIPYGCPPIRLDPPPYRKKEEPLRILFAGRMSQQKGLADLVEACQNLAFDWQLVLAGPQVGSMPRALTTFLSDTRCRWLGPVAYSHLMQVMRDVHLFVFPSLFEGFGMVLTEALAAGLPVITTPHSAGPDLLSYGSAGFIVPIRSPSEIADKITWIFENEDERRAMADNALLIASQRSWLQYELSLASAILCTL